MPTTQEEAQKITEIIHDFLTEDQAKEVSIRLDEEVGKLTNNESLKVSLAMLRAICEKPKKVLWSLRALKSALWLVIAFHLLVVFGNLTAFFVLPFVIPWWGALPLCTFIIWLTFSPIPCPLTRLENMFRRKLGMPEVKFFVKHYIISPIKQIRK